MTASQRAPALWRQQGRTHGGATAPTMRHVGRPRRSPASACPLHVPGTRLPPFDRMGGATTVMPAGRHERPAKPFENCPVKRSVPRTLTDWFMDGMMPILPTLTQAGGWCRASGLFSNHNPTSRRRFMQRPIVTTHCTLQACKEDHGSPPFTRSERTMCFFHLILWASLPSGFWRSSVEPPPAQKIICRPG